MKFSLYEQCLRRSIPEGGGGGGGGGGGKRPRRGKGIPHCGVGLRRGVGSLRCGVGARVCPVFSFLRFSPKITQNLKTNHGNHSQTF